MKINNNPALPLYGNRYGHIRYDPPKMADSDFGAFTLCWFLGNALGDGTFELRASWLCW